MAQRLNKCPICKSFWYKVIEILNPKTTNMNCKAKLECEKCGNIWEDNVTSPFYQKQRERGWIR